MNSKQLTTNVLVTTPYASPRVKAVVLKTSKRILGDSLHGNTPGITEDEDTPGLSDF